MNDVVPVVRLNSLINIYYYIIVLVTKISKPASSEVFWVF